MELREYITTKETTYGGSSLVDTSNWNVSDFSVKFLRATPERFTLGFPLLSCRISISCHRIPDTFDMAFSTASFIENILDSDSMY